MIALLIVAIVVVFVVLGIVQVARKTKAAFGQIESIVKAAADSRSLFASTGGTATMQAGALDALPASVRTQIETAITNAVQSGKLDASAVERLHQASAALGHHVFVVPGAAGHEVMFRPGPPVDDPTAAPPPNPSPPPPAPPPPSA